MIHIFIKKVWTRSSEGVYRSTSSRTFFDNVTIVPMEDIMPVKGPHIKFYNQVFIGLLFLRTPEGTFYLVISVRELVTDEGASPQLLRISLPGVHEDRRPMKIQPWPARWHRRRRQRLARKVRRPVVRSKLGLGKLTCKRR